MSDESWLKTASELGLPYQGIDYGILSVLNRLSIDCMLERYVKENLNDYSDEYTIGWSDSALCWATDLLENAAIEAKFI
jgi:hypothetical protein